MRRATCYSLRHSAQNRHFYPRSPCGERPWQRGSRITYVEFLSTLSLRRATPHKQNKRRYTPYFYPRSPCGERHRAELNIRQIQNFYPRSPCGERHIPLQRVSISDHFYPRSPCGERLCNQAFTVVLKTFLSTLSLRRATPHCYQQTDYFFYFYPRSPCGERQSPRCGWLYIVHYFYPRSPCGERRVGRVINHIKTYHFYPRSPCGERHLRRHRGNDRCPVHFYPRSPCGERPIKGKPASPVIRISIHALLAESDGRCRCLVLSDIISIHALLAESDPSFCVLWC